MLAIPLILLAIFAVLLLSCYMLYRLVFRRGKVPDPEERLLRGDLPKPPYRDDILAGIRFIDAQPFEQLSITSRDGIKLSGRYYRAENEQALMILFHGYRSSARRDFSCVFEPFLKSGRSLLLVDQRAHGLSEGKTITFGVMERYDCLDWTNYAMKRFGKNLPIFLEGVSMGAATVLMTSAFHLPENVMGIIADCGFTSAEETIKDALRRKHYPIRFLWPFVRMGGLLFGHFDPAVCSVEDALHGSRLPVLLIHGEADDVVPLEMSRRNRDACAGKTTLVSVPGAKHGQSYLVDREKVQTAVTEFFKDSSRIARCAP